MSVHFCTNFYSFSGWSFSTKMFCCRNVLNSRFITQTWLTTLSSAFVYVPPWPVQEVNKIITLFSPYFEGRFVCAISESSQFLFTFMCSRSVGDTQTHTQRKTHSFSVWICVGLVLEITYIKTKAVGFKLISCLISWHMLRKSSKALSFLFYLFYYTLSCSNLC